MDVEVLSVDVVAAHLGVKDRLLAGACGVLVLPERTMMLSFLSLIRFNLFEFVVFALGWTNFHHRTLLLMGRKH